MSRNGSDGSTVGPVDAELSRIEAEVAAGNTDLRALGFWRLVERVKRDPGLRERLSERIGRVDQVAIERRFRVRPPVWLGNLALGAATVVFAALVPGAIALAEGNRFVYGPFEPRGTASDLTVAGLLLLVAAGGLSVSVHDLAHWLAGRAGGIRFSFYYLDGPFRIQPGLKTDYGSYLRAPARSRAIMHAAGALASKAAPFVVFAVAYVAHAGRDWELLPEWSLWGLLGFGVLQIVTDVVWSTKSSDWKKVARERRLARESADA